MPDVALASYEWPGVTSTCGGGGRVFDTLRSQLTATGHETTRLTDADDGHYATFPLRQQNRLHDRLDGIQPDIVHAAFSVPTALPLTSRDEPLVVTVMGSDIHNPERFRLLRPLLDRVNSHVLDAADLVTAPSTDLAERTRRLTDTPVVHIPHGIDTDQYTWRERRLHDPVRVLTVSRLAPGKHIPLAIEAVTRAREHVDIEYRVVGDGSETAHVAQAAAASDWLEWPGWADDVQPHYDWADVFLLPSAWEAFGLVYCEALASGLPVVATPNGGPADIVADSVGQLAPAAPSKQAQALLSVIDNYETHQAATEEYVEERFSAAEMARQHHNQYIKLC